MPALPPPADDLVTAHLDLVRLVSKQVMRELGIPGHVRDELEAAAREGLVEASQRFDAGRGVPFRRFANHRVRGSVLDAIRREIPMRRRLAERLHAVESALALNETLSESLTPGSTPSDAASADTLLASHLEAVATAAVLGLSSQSDEIDDISPEPISPEDALSRAQIRAEVTRILDDLEEPERSVIRRHHIDGERLDIVAAELGVSRSWASRIHSRGVELLAKRLRHLR